MRPPAQTLAGVGEPAPRLSSQPPKVNAAMPAPAVEAPPEDPPWAPARAEPGDMGWDLVHGIRRSMQTNVAPRYNFEDDDEPTSEIALPGEHGQG
jgi:hypothetical protein